MARQISEIQSLPLYQVFGAPLLAIVQGEAQACQATAEFIQQIGFTSGAGDGTAAGRLRMLDFTFTKPDADGTPRAFRAEIPLLAMVPIPSIQVKDADLEFNVKITDLATTSAATAVARPTTSAAAATTDWLSPRRVEFRAAMGRLEKATEAAKSSTDVQMRVKIRVQQADTPVGLAYLFRLMDQTTSSTRAGDTLTT